MLTGPEIDTVEFEVSKLEDSDLLSSKQIFISKGEESGLLMKHNTGRDGKITVCMKKTCILLQSFWFG